MDGRFSWWENYICGWGIDDWQESLSELCQSGFFLIESERKNQTANLMHADFLFFQFSI